MELSMKETVHAQPLKSLSNAEALDLAKYIIAQKNALISEVASRVDAFEFFNLENCISYFSFPALKQSNLEATLSENLKAFCEEKAIHFDDAQVLLGLYLKPLGLQIGTFDKTYSSFKTIIESQAFQTKILPALNKAAIRDGSQTFEQMQMNTAQAFSALKANPTLDPRPLYKTLKLYLEDF